MSNSNLSRIIITSFFSLIGLALSVPAVPDTKLSPSEIIAKHLESIGTAEARARVHGTRITGTCILTVREGGTGQAQGQVTLASLGEMNFIKMTFESEDNPTWFKFDGSKVSVSQFRPGRRTRLEYFFAAYDALIKEGLIGGTLSESWPLLNTQAKNPKLESAGVKKIAGKELLALKYMPRKGSDLKITLYFDTATYRHVRTEYTQTIYSTDQQRIASSGGGLPSTNSQQRATSARINAFEEFSDFREEQGLSLPHTYNFELSIQSDVRPALVNWTFGLSDFKFSSPFDSTELTTSK